MPAAKKKPAPAAKAATAAVPAKRRSRPARLATSRTQLQLGRWELDLATQTGRWSAEMFRLLHRDPAHGAPAFEDFLQLVHPEDRALVAQAGKCAADDREPFHFEYRTDPARGPVRHVSATIHVFRDARGRPVRMAGTALDVTERKLAEQVALRLAAIVDSSDDAIIGKTIDGVITSWNPAAERIFGYSTRESIGQRMLMLIPPERHNEEAEILALYAALSQVNQAIVWSPNREELFKKVCQVLVEYGGFRMAWIGWQDPASQRLIPVAEWGDVEGYLRVSKVFTDDRPEARGPTGTAFREQRHFICNDVDQDPATRPWREEARRVGFRASAAFPVRRDGKVVGTLTVYADEVGFFQDKEIHLLEEAAGDVSFGLDNFVRDEERRVAEEKVRQERDFSAAILNSLPGVFYLYDQHGRFLRWNQNFERITGYGAAEIAAMHPLDFFAGADKKQIAAKIEEVFLRGDSYAEAGFVTKDGRSLPYCFTGIRAEIDGQKCLVGVGLDITARQLAEKAWEASESRYRTLFAYAPDGIVVADSKSYYLDANESMCRMLGYTREEFIGLHASDIVDDAELPHIGRALSVIKSKSDYKRVWRFRRKDGSVFPAEVIGAVMPDGHLLAMIRDISERMRAEEELQRSEHDQRELADQLTAERNRLMAAQAVAKIGSWETDVATGKVTWSDEAHRIFGTDAAVFRPTHDGFLQLVHPEDRAMVENAFTRSLAVHSIAKIEHRLLLASGAGKVVEERWRVILDDQDRPLRAVGTCQDITERKQAELEVQLLKQRLTLATDAAAIGIWDWDITIDRWYATATYFTMLGYAAQEGYSERNFWLPRLHPDDRPAVAKKIDAVLAGSMAPYTYEARMQHADGSYRWVKVIGRVLATDGQGRATRMLGVRIDITEQKQAEIELRAAEQQLHSLVERLNTVREEEAKRIARELHDDLGQQLTALNMELADLEAKLGEVPPRQRGQFDRMRTGIDHTIEVVQKISGELRLGQLDVLGLTAAIECQVQEFSRRSAISCRIERLDEVADLSEAQTTALFRILQEALTNIARHAGATEVSVSLEAGPDAVTMQVRDNGRGITASEMDDKKAIGLLGMRERAQILGGDLIITGGAGTTVRVRLPLNRTGTTSP